MRSDEILALLRKRYPLPEYALMAEVANQTGFGVARYADALVMGLWPSRGLHLSGFEIKVARGDWLREKKRPDKADEIGKFCDFWWVVCPDETVAKVDELPPAWGLMHVLKGKLKIVKDAQRIDAQTMTRNFLACIVRRVFEQSPTEHTLKKTADEAYQRGRKEGLDQGNSHEKALEKRLTELHRKVAEFEALSGIRLDSWHIKQHAAELRTILDGGLDGRLQDLARIRQMAKNIHQNVEQELAAIDALQAGLKAKQQESAA